MTTESLEEALERQAEEAWTAQAQKQAELVNRVFRLDEVELVEYTDFNNEPQKAYIGSIVLDGEQDTQRFWLAGRMVMPQVKMLVEGKHLPLFATLIRDSSKNGNPYKLLLARTAAPVAMPPVATLPVARASAHPDLDRLVQFCRDNKFMTPTGVDTRILLDKLGVAVTEGTKPADTWDWYVKTTATRAKVEGDAVYAVLLQELVKAMALSEPEPEEIPFE